MRDLADAVQTFINTDKAYVDMLRLGHKWWTDGVTCAISESLGDTDSAAPPASGILALYLATASLAAGTTTANATTT
jgi:hypothetical protein